MFATKLSSFRGCCYLGDVCDPVAANEIFPNRPLALEKIVCERCDSEIINLAVPICSALERWKLYSRHGDDAFIQYFGHRCGWEIAIHCAKVGKERAFE